MRGAITLIVCLLAGASALHAEVQEIPQEQRGAFILTQTVMVPGTTEAAFDAFTGDVTPWWDHSFSGAPARMYIEPWPGGGFYEWFDDEGRNGVKHATVIFAKRGEMLRLDGPLGLSGRAVDFVTSLGFEAVEDSTRLTVTVHCSGEIDAQLANLVDGVWWHFIGERFKPWYEAGAEGKKALPLKPR